jgi:secreted trypsin-like serine protease
MRALSFLAILTAGLLSGRPAQAIIAGSDADWADYPWIAGIVRTDLVTGPGLIGGGALVGDQWVVTAAHSVSGLSASDLEIWLGTSRLDDRAGRFACGVLAIHVHPGFATDNGASVNDLALLLLDRRATGFPVLPLVESDGDLTAGDDVRVAGWGTSSVGLATPTTVLQEALARILSQLDATAVFGPVIESVHLPAVDPAGIATPCVGDSGSPLVKTIAGQDRLAGLVSFGTIDCSDATKPTIYTRVPSFAGWINERLVLTATDPVPSLTGKGRAVTEGKSPRTENGTDFGTLGRRGSSRTRAFRLTNQGTGWLTVRAATVRGRGFSRRKAPATIIPAATSTTLRVRFSHPRRSGRFPGKLILQTNDPASPVSVYRLAGRTR